MSTPSPHVPQPSAPAHQRELRIYSHSGLFYWWPVWATGFLMAFLTIIDGSRMAFVPSKSVVGQVGENKDWYIDVEGQASSQKLDGHSILVAPPDKKIVMSPVHMARSKDFGVVFAVVLLMIIVISQVPLRGLWSVILILLVFLMTVIFALAEWWTAIFTYLSYLQIHINLGGYLFISIILFGIWTATVFVFDRRTYVAITSGQVRVCMAVGAGETVYDTTGMTFQKKQDDLFRHWIVGMGSGDLIIHGTATMKEIDLPNVLFIGSKITEIEKLIKEREVV